jgi:hypothetical protein
MSNSVEEKVEHDAKKVAFASWDDVIADVNRQIEEGNERLKGLKRAIRSFKYLKDSGQPFHGARHN